MKKVFYILIPAILLILSYSILGDSSQDYVKEIEAKRAEQIEYLRTSDESPFVKFDLKFKEPTYYPISVDYRVRANLERLKKTERVVLPTSNNVEKTFVKFAYASFQLQGQQLKLLILKPAGFGSGDYYFLGFADDTSGDTTYGGGRYIDLEIGKSDNIIIDFNMAYNPYCAYSTGYSCPIPPAENILPVAIEAGEKDYTH